MELAALAGRLEALEAQQAHNERIIEELNEIVTRQWSEIDRLKRKLSAIDDQIAAVEHMARTGEKEAPPPHY